VAGNRTFSRFGRTVHVGRRQRRRHAKAKAYEAPTVFLKRESIKVNDILNRKVTRIAAAPTPGIRMARADLDE
jgi:hypothetical protein